MRLHQLLVLPQIPLLWVEVQRAAIKMQFSLEEHLAET